MITVYKTAVCNAKLAMGKIIKLKTFKGYFVIEHAKYINITTIYVVLREHSTLI